MRLPRTQIITLANQKGGCGKTTSSVSWPLLSLLRATQWPWSMPTPSATRPTLSGLIRTHSSRRAGIPWPMPISPRRQPARLSTHSLTSGFKGRLTLIPGNRGLNTVSHRLDAQLQATVSNENYSDLDADDIKNEHRVRLRQSLESLRGHRDIVVIDTPPELGS